LEFTLKWEPGIELFPELHPQLHSYFSTVSAALETMQGQEQTTMAVVPGVAVPSKNSVMTSQMWNEKKEKFLKGEPKVLGVRHLWISGENDFVNMHMVFKTMQTFNDLSHYLLGTSINPKGKSI
jgi:hypothetical protein